MTSVNHASQTLRNSYFFGRFLLFIRKYQFSNGLYFGNKRDTHLPVHQSTWGGFNLTLLGKQKVPTIQGIVMKKTFNVRKKSGNFNLTLGKLIERNKKLGKFEEFDHRKEEAFTVTLMAKILSLIIEKLSTF